MRINAKKTNLMGVSAATSFEAQMQVELDGQLIESQPSMKI